MKRGTPTHPKLYNLMSVLKISRPTAVGYLELLWHFTAEYAPDGWLGRYPVARIEAAMEWRGGSGRLVAAMWGVGFLDGDTHLGLCVHDWEDHADNVVKKRLSRLGKCFVKVTDKVTINHESLTDGVESLTEKLRSLVANCNPRARALPIPIPIPIPTPPNAALPLDQTNEVVDSSKPSKQKFVKPTVDEVSEFCRSHGITNVDPEKFWHHYESCGWKRGKTPITNWKSAVHTWKRNGYDNQPTLPQYRETEMW